MLSLDLSHIWRGHKTRRSHLLSQEAVMARLLMVGPGAGLYNLHSGHVITCVSGLRRRHPVLRDLPSGVSDWSAANPLGLEQPRPSPSHQQQRHPALRLHQQVHLSALTLAVFWRLPQVPHLPLPLLHLGAARPAHREVSARRAFLLFFTRQVAHNEMNLFLW